MGFSKNHSVFLLIARALALAFVLLLANPALAERVHTVAPGHTLGKIAKRYNITIEALCEANNINRRTPIKPGQRIIIPEAQGKKTEKKQPDNKSAPSKRRPQAEKSGESIFTTHRVASGHTLGRIAKRYGSSVDTIRDANGLEPRTPLRIGTCLVVPLTSKSAKQYRSQPLPCAPKGVDLKGVEKERRPATTYAQRPSRSGVVHMVRGGRTFRGRLFDSKGQPIKASVEKMDALLFDRRTSKVRTTDSDLLRRIVQVSDYFGGRRMIIVSGYREEAANPHTTRSKHAEGKAIDFRMDGVPNEALRDYCHSLSGVGVGYYPNSSFIHLDVRSITTHWTDVSGPGEPPQYTSTQNPKKKR